jgi:hypothetical protein
MMDLVEQMVGLLGQGWRCPSDAQDLLTSRGGDTVADSLTYENPT